MNLLELRNAARVLGDDSTVQSLWTDTELTLYINEAEREAARRSRLILDPDTESVNDAPTTSSWARTTTVATVTRVAHGLLNGAVIPIVTSSAPLTIVLGEATITYVDADTFTIPAVNVGAATGTLTYLAPTPLCVVDLAPGASIIPIHKKIIFVKSVRLDSRELPLPRCHIRDVDARFPSWPSDPAGDPMIYMPNWKTGFLRLYPGTDIADVARLQVIRLPLQDMAADTDEPEIDEQYHMTMLHWALHRMFLKPDEDTKDKVKAGDYLAMFEQEFGQRSSAIDQTWIQREHGYDDYEGVF
jgi:hypothetical protein